MLNKNISKVIFILTLATITNAQAASSTYCDGYIEGYKSVPGFEDSNPTCPFPDRKEDNSAAMIEGLNDGIAAANAE